METIANSEFFRTVFEPQKEEFEKRYHQKIKLSISLNSSLFADCYQLESVLGGCQLAGGSKAALLNGLSLLDVAVKSGHLGDYVGGQESLYPYRWLRLDQIPPDLSVEKLCLRVLQLGYNGVVVHSIPKNIEVFKQFGVKVVLAASQPGICPFDSSWNPLIKEMELIDGIYWKGTYHLPHYLLHAKAKDSLQMDLAIREVKALESLLGQNTLCIYEIDPFTRTHWIPELMDEMGSNTLLSFSSLSGGSNAIHCDPHPLWELLRQMPDTSATRLLPIVNMGSVNQGDGLWPIIPIGLLEFVMTHMRRQPFGGAIVNSRYLSQPGTFLDGSLWTAGHSLRGQHPPGLLLESWCKAFYPSLSTLELLRDTWNLSKRLSGLNEMKNCPTEECRLISEGILAEISRLQRLVRSFQDEQTPSIQDYFIYFFRDARRKVLYFLQQHHAPMVNVLDEDALLESFWTTVQKGTSPGLTHSAKVSLLETPQRGDEGSVMDQIYQKVTKSQ